MAGFLGMRTTYDMVTDERPKQWRLGINDQYPNANPFTHLINRLGKTRVVDPEFNWWERSHDVREMTVGTTDTPGAAAAAAADTLDVVTPGADYVRKHSVILNTVTEERVVVTADPSDSISIAIKRGVGATGTQAAWNNGDTLMVIGTAHPEGDTAPKALSFDPTKKTNYCQIFRNSADATRTALATTLRTGNYKKRIQKEALKQHEEDKERAFIFGKPEEYGSSNSIQRFTGGFLHFATGHIKDFTAGLTLSGWREFLYDVFEDGSDEKILYAGATLIEQLEAMADDNSVHMGDIPTSETFGMNMKRWGQSLGGTLAIMEHKMLTKSTTYADWGIVVDPAFVQYCHVKGADTTWLPGREGNDADRKTGEYLAECGLEIMFGTTSHGVIKNCNSYSP